jgi:hypothetical protein
VRDQARDLRSRKPTPGGALAYPALHCDADLRQRHTGASMLRITPAVEAATDAKVTLEVAFGSYSAAPVSGDQFPGSPRLRVCSAAWRAVGVVRERWQLRR